MSAVSEQIIEPSSYKDSAGSVVYSGNKVLRLINESKRAFYKKIHNQGFYQKCIDQGYLFPFEVVEQDDQLQFVSKKIQVFIYPYEWGFEQFKSAALFHLRFLEFCLKHDYTLKDASPFNVQFVHGKPFFIDYLSIEPLEAGAPWNGYKQFCEMFVAPLVLASKLKGDWIKQLMINLEGFKLDHVANILPLWSKFSSLIFFHILSQSKYKVQGNRKEVSIDKKKVQSIVKHLVVELEVLKPFSKESEWLNYKEEFPYSKEELQIKNKTVSDWLEEVDGKVLLDVGANHVSFYEHMKSFKEVVLMDLDQRVVDHLFLNYAAKGFSAVHMDVSMMSPSLGLNLKERSSFVERIKPDVVLGLAVIHHLFHQRNIPLPRIAELFNLFNGKLIIEFIDESDEKFQMIRNPQNKHLYSKALFEASFSKYYRIEQEVEIKQGKRFMYLMSKLDG